MDVVNSGLHEFGGQLRVPFRKLETDGSPVLLRQWMTQLVPDVAVVTPSIEARTKRRANERDRHRMGTNAMARDAAGGVGDAQASGNELMSASPVLCARAVRALRGAEA